MTIYVGGLRDRLITENVRKLIEDSLDSLGWLTTNSLIQNSLTVTSGPPDHEVELLPNIVNVSAEDVSSDDAEMGSLLSDYRWSYAVDIYAEDEASGRHITGDVRAILEGKFASIGRIGAVFRKCIIFDKLPKGVSKVR